MKVIALSNGYHPKSPGSPAQYIRTGETFEVEDGVKASWFAPVDEPKQSTAQSDKTKKDTGA
ncbi:hypothetical protein SAMN05192560_0780 [Methylobacillus rhizosphaerae]|uniref:Uncharacterized protein n=1 Tax=Methylobacillus rhizosphaerae TaxID=551994 RepID=A0A238YTJ3_9PROT|nr:hypothetical protein [Methylobacillus rhizosphaerae]SNR73779.1 hypothetical protein SAMN05192560_0780 [Methylobacillus rhizosphaerae]